MAQGTVHSQEYHLRIKNGLRSVLLAVATANLGIQGEPLYTTDDKQLFVHDGTRPQPVQTLDMALTHSGGVVVDNGDVVYDF